MDKKTTALFRTKEIDLACYLRFKGFKPFDNPVEDSAGTRWVIFEKTPQLNKEVLSFLSGNAEFKLLNEFRKTRSFLLDTKPARQDQEVGNE